jgi:predicted site-specific integrase-resolvase
MTETLHHKKVTELTGYSRRSLDRFVEEGVIKCVHDGFGLPRYSQEVVTKLNRRRAAKKRP